MSYLVFARKWRPLTFDDVVGQEHITETLKKAIEKDRVAHAYIFTGTRGVGKTTTARILARALNCEKGPTPAPCGECTNCKDIIGGSSFDVLEIDGASNNSVNDIRDLRENIGYSSMGGKYRIFVIDEVHMLSNSAFNALLKTLEEPPRNVIFIFATTEPQKIPATIHSRCQRYDFRRIDAEHILERIIHICDAESISYERSALMLVAQKADGSMRDALSLLDQVYSFCRESLNEKEVRSVLGLVGTEVYDRIMDAIADKKAAIALGLIQDVLYQGFDLQEFLTGLQEHLRNLLYARIPDALATRGIDIDGKNAEHLTTASQRFSEGDLLRMTEIVRNTERDIKWSTFPRFAVELLLLKLVHLDTTVSIEKITQLLGGGNSGPQDSTAPSPARDDALKKKLNSEPAPAPEPPPDDTVKKKPAEQSTGTSLPPIRQPYEVPRCEPTEPAPVPDPPPAPPPEQPTFIDSAENDHTTPDISAIWPPFIETLLRDRPKLGSFLSLASVAASGSHILDLRFPVTCNFQFKECNQKHNREDIIRILHQITGKTFEIRITLESDASPSDGKNYFTPEGLMPLTINDEIEHEPIIQKVLDMFDGEILE